ncbi:hypothetical protein, partial [Burkholderia pseudomallei]|uniref:hypothetical protein n=1 Tax=Burkholderia pseudomallei TaxID=28450 RepID=UPI001C82FDC3
PTSSSSGIVQLKQPRPFSKIEMARRNQAGQNLLRTPPKASKSRSGLYNLSRLVSLLGKQSRMNTSVF